MHRKDAAAASPPWENYRRALNPCRNLKLTPPGVEKKKEFLSNGVGEEEKKSLVRRRAFPNRSEIQSKLCFKSYQFWKEKRAGGGGGSRQMVSHFLPSPPFPRSPPSAPAPQFNKRTWLEGRWRKLEWREQRKEEKKREKGGKEPPKLESPF